MFLGLGSGEIFMAIGLGLFSTFIAWGTKRGNDKNQFGNLFYAKKYWYYPIFWIFVYLLLIKFVI